MLDPGGHRPPRLRFRFDRKSLGRLRQLVDAINRDTVVPPENAQPSA